MPPPNIQASLREVWWGAGTIWRTGARKAPKTRAPLHPPGHTAPTSSPAHKAQQGVVKSVSRGIDGFIKTIAPIFSSTSPGYATSSSLRSSYTRQPLNSQWIVDPARFAARSRPAFAFRSPNIPGRSVTQLGLGTARNFSSARPVFQDLQNVVQNAPMALRALVDQSDELLDKRKGKEAIRKFKASKKGEAKGKGKAGSRLRLRQDAVIPATPIKTGNRAAKAFDMYFFASEEVDADSSASASPSSSTEAEEVHVPTAPAILVILPLEPDLSTLNQANDVQASQRILTPSFLSDIRTLNELYALHTARVRNITNRLADAGCFDDPSVQVKVDLDNNRGRKEVVVRFDGATWSRKDVELALEIWEGQTIWFSIREEEVLIPAASPGTPTTGSPGMSDYGSSSDIESRSELSGDYDSDSDMSLGFASQESRSPSPRGHHPNSGTDIVSQFTHDQVADSFVLPSISFGARFVETAMSSPDTASEASGHTGSVADWSDGDGSEAWDGSRALSPEQHGPESADGSVGSTSYREGLYGFLDTVDSFPRAFSSVPSSSFQART